ncbi:MAG TPA: hypothetical protein H9881_13410 [Candidatus Stackebrandtia excrementipullorum]|nr:hypothetical protein [Candidatus Stackebrandtia excrementipullorum]
MGVKIKRVIAIGAMALAASGVASTVAASTASADGVTYDGVGCYVQWFNTYGKNACGAASEGHPGGNIALYLQCDTQTDYQGPYTYIGANAKVDPIDDFECTFAATGGHNMWNR